MKEQAEVKFKYGGNNSCEHGTRRSSLARALRAGVREQGVLSATPPRSLTHADEDRGTRATSGAQQLHVDAVPTRSASGARHDSASARRHLPTADGAAGSRRTAAEPSHRAAAGAAFVAAGFLF